MLTVDFDYFDLQSGHVLVDLVVVRVGTHLPLIGQRV